MGSFVFDIFVLLTFLLILGYIIFVAIHTYSTNTILFWVSIGLAVLFFGLIIWNIIELANDVYTPPVVIPVVPTPVIQAAPIIQTPIMQAPVIQTTPIMQPSVQNPNNLPVVKISPI